jgi:hypothetical protein
MKRAIVKIHLKYDFAESISEEDIIEFVENQELPINYKENSFELLSIKEVK